PQRPSGDAGQLLLDPIEEIALLPGVDQIGSPTPAVKEIVVLLSPARDLRADVAEKAAPGEALEGRARDPTLADVPQRLVDREDGAGGRAVDGQAGEEADPPDEILDLEITGVTRIP